MSKHTPGPWFQHHSPISIRICDGAHDTVAGCKTIAEAEIIAYEREESIANTRLIAAAPELLEALKMLLDRTANPITDHGFYTLEDARNKAEAAIRKAEGK